MILLLPLLATLPTSAGVLQPLIMHTGVYICTLEYVFLLHWKLACGLELPLLHEIPLPFVLPSSLLSQGQSLPVIQGYLAG